MCLFVLCQEATDTSYWLKNVERIVTSDTFSFVIHQEEISSHLSKFSLISLTMFYSFPSTGLLLSLKFLFKKFIVMALTIFLYVDGLLFLYRTFISAFCFCNLKPKLKYSEQKYLWSNPRERVGINTSYTLTTPLSNFYLWASQFAFENMNILRIGYQCEI